MLTDLYEERLGLALEASGVPPRAAATFLANGLLGILTWWLDAGMPVDAEELDELFRELTDRGTLAALRNRPVSRHSPMKRSE